MGSFNTTCFISNQVIATDDMCRLTPIVQNSTFRDVVLNLGAETVEQKGIAHSTCYADCFWKPLGGFIPAAYDDYGRFKLIFSPKTRGDLLSFFSQVYRNCPIVSEGENSSHDLAFDFSAFILANAPDIHKMVKPSSSRNALGDDVAPATVSDDVLDAQLTACWDYVFEVSGKHRLFIKDSNSMRPLQFAAMHEAAYESLVESTSRRKTWEGESLEQNSFLLRTLRHARAEAAERVEHTELRIKKLEQESGKPSEQSLDKAIFFSWAFTDAVRAALDQLSGNCRIGGSRELALLSALSVQIAKRTISDEEFIRRVLPVVNDRYALGGMNDYDLRFSPLVYAGQDYLNEQGQAYVKFITEVSRKVTRGCKLRMYGEFLEYSFHATSEAQVQELIEKTPEYDAAAEIVSIVPATDTIGAAEGQVFVKFSCTLELEDLRDLIEELENSALMLSTVHAGAAVA